MSKESNVVNFYVMCNKLKTLIRKGWIDWSVHTVRRESVAEHIYSTIMLAIAMKSEYQYNIDIMKVAYMLAIHELGECLIDDLTQFQISKENKKIIEHMAVHDILSDLLDGEQIEKIYLEFDERKTKEAQFAHLCDKLECDLQSKLYGEDNLVDLTEQKNNATFYNEKVQSLLNEGYTWEEMWLIFGQRTYSYDENFIAISNYALNNKIKNNSHITELEYKYKKLVKEYLDKKNN